MQFNHSFEEVCLRFLTHTFSTSMSSARFVGACAVLLCCLVAVQAMAGHEGHIVLETLAKNMGPRGTGVIGALAGAYNMSTGVTMLSPCVMRTVHTHVADEIIYMTSGEHSSVQGRTVHRCGIAASHAKPAATHATYST